MCRWILWNHFSERYLRNRDQAAVRVRLLLNLHIINEEVAVKSAIRAGKDVQSNGLSCVCTQVNSTLNPSARVVVLA
jgi:hypothetical protein